jgi:hypothetical protein
MSKVVVSLTDEKYYERAIRTIKDIRFRGEWTGDLVLITVGFNAPKEFLDSYQVTPFYVDHIDTSTVVENYKKYPIKPTDDNREFIKLTQWDKFYVFHPFFLKWNTVVFMDAGLRVFNPIRHLTSLDCSGVLMAPINNTTFEQINEIGVYPEVDEKLFQEYDRSILTEECFLNCIWMYDTSLINKITMDECVNTMNKYPIWRNNEMSTMNLLFAIKYRVWKPFPQFTENGEKELFGWCEKGRMWNDFCFIKYPYTINFNTD